MNTTTRVRAGQGATVDPTARRNPEHGARTLTPDGSTRMKSTTRLHAGSGSMIDPDGLPKG
jgi:hypothetical protein